MPRARVGPSCTPFSRARVHLRGAAKSSQRIPPPTHTHHPRAQAAQAGEALPPEEGVEGVEGEYRWDQEWSLDKPNPDAAAAEVCLCEGGAPGAVLVAGRAHTWCASSGKRPADKSALCPTCPPPPPARPQDAYLMRREAGAVVYSLFAMDKARRWGLLV